MKTKLFKIALSIIAFLIAILLSIAAWFLYTARRDGFMVPSSQVEIIDHVNDMYLVYTISGFQEKVVSFGIYRSEPKFDITGRTESIPFSTVIWDPDSGYIKSVVLRGNELKIVYTNNESESVAHSTVKLTIEN